MTEPAYKGRSVEKNLSAAKGFLGSVFLLGTSQESMEIAAKILAYLERKGIALELRDVFIGSICLVNSVAIMTRNLRHFRRIPGLEVIEIQ